MSEHRSLLASFLSRRPAVRDVNEMIDARLTLGQRAADWVAATMGSWRFIIVQTMILAAWVALNVTAWVRHWDPYPFILMNLVLSMQAAYAAPIIMMSQNRQATRDRLEAHNDFLTDQKAEEEVRAIMQHLEAQDGMLREILARLDAREAGDERPSPEPRSPWPDEDAPRGFPRGSSFP